MDVDRQIKMYKEWSAVIPDERKIRETTEASVESFLQAEGERVLAYHSFLYMQFRLIRKRWWVLQAAILTLLWMALVPAGDNVYVYRSMGAAGALFVILIIPEMWKNRTNCCMEIESAAYYSLRQVYSARMLLFGLADIFLITVFGGAVTISLKITLAELLVQFLFPMAVAACICFVVLCSRYFVNEAAAAGLCILWSALWWCLLMNEQIYEAVTLPVWMILLGIVILFLALAVRSSIQHCEDIWEENNDGTQND